jgi:hypothetical protein
MKSVFGITTFTVDAQYYPAFALPLLLITISTAFIANSIFATRDARPLKNNVIMTPFVPVKGFRPFDQLKAWWKAGAWKPAFRRHHYNHADVKLNDIEKTASVMNEADPLSQPATVSPRPIPYGMSPAYGLVWTRMTPAHELGVQRNPVEQMPPTNLSTQPLQLWPLRDEAGVTLTPRTYSPTRFPFDATSGRQTIAANPPIDPTTLETILEQSPPLARSGPSQNLAHFGDDSQPFEDGHDVYYSGMWAVPD